MAVAELDLGAAELERLQAAIATTAPVALSLATQRLKPCSAWIAICPSTIARVSSLEVESGPRKRGHCSE